MTDKEKLEAVKAEIERRLERIELVEKDAHNFNADNLKLFCSQIKSAYQSLLDFINSLAKETVSEDLEEAARKYAKENYPDEPSVGQFGTGDYEPYVDMSVAREMAEEDFKAGAQWKKQKIINKGCDLLFKSLPMLVNYYDGESFKDATDRSNFIKYFRKELEKEG